eukprot:CAMPEP_0206259222 /NCGR_PEP_ID=MMETSP0047_2-20121206/26362_1 /ASSEMBLY_ACC=CAM_ASM_000192 /TAXON_ID=195065 /ORGANISM="Chroomonas mesostigmatica_cf, Strain CCMP1168" /LENGTH=53 /DNA_ID=CAMNT_0053686067 /DNA_START=84 /DNA_END=241 /DNA_ORIENTATION=-
MSKWALGSLFGCAGCWYVITLVLDQCAAGALLSTASRARTRAPQLVMRYARGT